jgi:hypothetical protein
MKLIAGILALLPAFVPAMGLRLDPTTSQATQPVCPTSGFYESKDCVKVITGCACDVSGWATFISRQNCTGCRLQYNYSWICTEGGNDNTGGTQTSDIGCDSRVDIEISSCPCDGTALISVGGRCGVCPSH